MIQIPKVCHEKYILKIVIFILGFMIMIFSFLLK